MDDAIAKNDRAASEKDLLREEPDKAKRALRRRDIPQQDLVMVREYAHQPRPGRRAGDRVDFTETLLWTAGARTDARTGELKASFALSDSVTSFKVLASGFDDHGALGAATSAIQSVRLVGRPLSKTEDSRDDADQTPGGNDHDREADSRNRARLRDDGASSPRCALMIARLPYTVPRSAAKSTSVPFSSA